MYNYNLRYTAYLHLVIAHSRMKQLDDSVVHVASSEPPSRAVTPLQSVTAGAASHGVDMSYYNKLLTHVPEDRTTVELILHCMVEQVCLLIRQCLYLIMIETAILFSRLV